MTDGQSEQLGPKGENKSYNATVESVRKIHESLMILRVVPDVRHDRFQAGQYTVLGLETSVTGGDLDLSEKLPPRKIEKRAYSYSCSMLDERGELHRAHEFPYLEFYIAQILGTGGKHPLLTPWLFDLEAGERLFIGAKATGRYTLAPVQKHEDVVFIATGTGEAPHNGMIAELLLQQHRGRVIAVTCARNRVDLAYLNVHRELERRYSNYKYIALTTREPENVDASHPAYMGRRYLQEYIRSGHFEEQADFELDPQSTHVFMCGNPSMIGAPNRDGHLPDEPGMVRILVDRGFGLPTADSHGHLHYEKYW